MTANNRPFRGLNPKQARFVKEYIACGNASEAARRAGYAPGSAKSRGWALLQVRSVKAAVARHKQALAERASYDAEKAMDETTDAIEFAREKGNAMAMVKAIELRSKLAGLLIDRHEDVTPLNLLSAIEAGRSRLRPIYDVTPSQPTDDEADETAVESEAREPALLEHAPPEPDIFG